MPTYISLVNWTDQGIRNYRETVERADAVAAEAQRLGGSVKELYWTMGPYDAIGVFDLPDDETASALALAVGSQGNLRTTTLRAYNRDDVQRILQTVG